jgi:hypothetical protein
MILNLTQHAATPEQIADGVADLPDDLRDLLIEALTVDQLPTKFDILARCQDVVNIALSTEAWEPPATVMIGGAPWLMGPLAHELREQVGCRVVFAFSKRESVETLCTDGSVKKSSVFKHGGFIEAA